MSQSGPAVPDYVSAAQAQNAQNLQYLNQQTQANRPNQTTPFGSSTWSQDPNTGQWTNNITFDDQMQALLGRQIRTAQQGSDVSSRTYDAAEALRNQYMGSNIDLTKYSKMADGVTRDRAEAALMERLNPLLTQDYNRLNASLAAQGLAPGSQAFNAGMDTFNRQSNDARLAAIAQGGAEQTRELQNIAQQMQMASAAKNDPLNAFTALMGNANGAQGQMVQPPQFPNFTNAGAATAPDMASLLGMGYQNAVNANSASSARNQGIGGALGTIGGAWLTGGQTGASMGGALGGLLGGLF